MKEQDEVYCDRQLCVDQQYTPGGGCHKCPAGKNGMKEQDERKTVINSGLTNVFGCKCTQEDCFSDRCGHHFLCEQITSFILADRRRCLEEVEKPLESLRLTLRQNGYEAISDEVRDVDEALSIIKTLKG